MVNYDFNGKIVLVTAASKGIGLAIAQEFYKAGANVAICARNESVLKDAVDKIKENNGGEIIGYAADLKNFSQCEQMIDKAESYFSSSIEILINNSKNIIWHNKYIPNNEVHQYFSASDMLLMPYRDITQSGVASLSLSYSCPVMISNVGTVHEIIKDRENGIIVDSQSPDVFADELESCLDSGILDRISNNINQTPDKLGWEDFTSRIIDIYEQSKS